jgi:hypothetical protein
MPNIYNIKQSERNDYDTYSDCVVVADNEDDARNMNPDGPQEWARRFSSWASSPEKVTVTLIGTASDGIECGFICKSFHAG